MIRYESPGTCANFAIDAPPSNLHCPLLIMDARSNDLALNACFSVRHISFAMHHPDPSVKGDLMYTSSLLLLEGPSIYSFELQRYHASFSCAQPQSLFSSYNEGNLRRNPLWTIHSSGTSILDTFLHPVNDKDGNGVARDTGCGSREVALAEEASSESSSYRGCQRLLHMSRASKEM